MVYDGLQARIREALVTPMTVEDLAKTLGVKKKAGELVKPLEELLKDKRVTFDEESKTYQRFEDPMDIPEFLKVENRDPEVTARHEKKLEALRRAKEEERKKLEVKKPQPPPPSTPKKAAAKSVQKRPSRTGLVLIADIAKEFKLTPKEARGLLRGAKFKKPDVGWAFNKSEVDTVRKVLKGTLDTKEKEPKRPTAKKTTKISAKREGIRDAVWSGKTKSPADKRKKK